VTYQPTTVAKPKSNSARDFPVVPRSTGWDTVTLVGAALDAHERGEFRLSAYLLEAFGRDDRIPGVFGTRIRALLASPLSMAPPESAPEAAARKVADAAQADWPSIADEATWTQLHRWGIGLGIGVAAKTWDTRGDRWVPRLRVWYPGFVRFDWDSRTYRIQTQSGEVELPEGGNDEWLVHTPYGYHRGWMDALVRNIGNLFLERGYAKRDWSRHDELHGQGLIKAIVPPQASESDRSKDRFVENLANRGSEPVIECEQDPQTGKGYDVDLVESETDAHKTFKEHLGEINSSVAIAILGQNLTTEVKEGSRAAASVHDNVRLDVAHSDATTLGSTARNQVLKPYAAFNFGSADLAPTPTWELQPPEDKAKTTDALSKLGTFLTAVKTAAAPVAVRELLEQIGVPVLTPEEEAKLQQEAADRAAQAQAALQKAGRQGGAQPGGSDAPAADDEEPEPAKAELARRKPLTGQAYVDALVERGLRRAVLAFAPALRKTTAEAEHANDFDSLRERLEALAGRLTSTDLADEFYRALVMVELAGRAAVLAEAGEATETLADGSAPPNPAHFEDAVKAWRRRVPIADEDFRKLDSAAKRRAFTVAGVADLDLVSQVWEAIDAAVAEGTTYADFKAKVGAALEAAWGGDAPARLETIYRTNVQTAYSAGRYVTLTDPAILKRRPYWKFSAVNDSRTSPICAPIGGTVLPASDPFWLTHQPPLHHRCRSAVIALTADQAETAGIAAEAPEAEPAEGFGAPPDLADWQPDLTRHPAPLVAAWRRAHESNP
jgi:SPP1 gp7 family putative phage head morphogenesis protein